MTEKPISCIVKNIDGMAKKLFVDDFFNGYVALKPITGQYATPLCLKQEKVFKFSQELFEELKRIFEEGDHDALDRAWQKAEIWSPEISK